jgi:hypothetical protein
VAYQLIKWERQTAKLNPAYIYITCKDKKIKIKNNGKKYSKLFPETKDEVTRNKDLFFV